MVVKGDVMDINIIKNANADIKIKVVEGRLKHKVKDTNSIGVILCIDDLIRLIQEQENLDFDYILELLKEFRDATSVI